MSGVDKLMGTIATTALTIVITVVSAELVRDSQTGQEIGKFIRKKHVAVKNKLKRASGKDIQIEV